MIFKKIGRFIRSCFGVYGRCRHLESQVQAACLKILELDQRLLDVETELKRRYTPVKPSEKPKNDDHVDIFDEKVYPVSQSIQVGWFGL